MAVLVLAMAALMLTGCAAVVAGPNCALAGETFKVGPALGMADHMAVPPGNQQQFTVTAAQTAPIGCPVSTAVVLLHATWANPDPTDVSISSANDATNGLATCLGATTSPVVLTASFTLGIDTGTTPVTLSCK